MARQFIYLFIYLFITPQRQHTLYFILLYFMQMPLCMTHNCTLHYTVIMLAARSKVLWGKGNGMVSGHRWCPTLN